YVTVHTPHGSTTFDPGNPGQINIEELRQLLIAAAKSHRAQGPEYTMTPNDEVITFRCYPLWKGKYIWGDSHNPYTAGTRRGKVDD
ncbi:MAG: hypothetical protein ACRETN_02130, partial [Nevskiales bacterium]